MPIGILEVRGFEVFGKHGYYAEEQVLGGLYRWDVRIRVHDAIYQEGAWEKQIYNYEDIIRVIKEVNCESEAFIERLCSKVYVSLNKLFENNQGIEVTVEKQNVPINRLKSSAYTISSI
jgi:dihydroneopterin aldolase